MPPILIVESQSNYWKFISMLSGYGCRLFPTTEKLLSNGFVESNGGSILSLSCLLSRASKRPTQSAVRFHQKASLASLLWGNAPKQEYFGNLVSLSWSNVSILCLSFRFNDQI